MLEVKKYSNAYRQTLVDNAQDPDLHNALGMCALRLGVYDEARRHFQSAVEGDISNSESYFYLAVALLDGKPPTLQTIDVIQRAQRYADAAIRLEARAAYYFFLLIINIHFYERKFLNPPIPTSFYQSQIEVQGVSEMDQQTVLQLLGMG